MEFFILHEKLSEEDAKETTSILLHDDKNNTMVYVGVASQQDNIDGWRNALKYLQRYDYQQLEILLKVIPQLLTIKVSTDVYPTYLSVLFAMLKFLERDLARNLFQEHLESYKLLQRSLFCFGVELKNDNYVVIFSRLKENLWEMYIPVNKFDEYPVEVSQASLVASYQKKPEQVIDFIENHIHFQANIDKANLGNIPTTFKVFISLSKALVFLIKQDSASLGLYISLISDICSFIVKNEREDVEAQKTHLEPILNSHENEERKLKRLNDLIQEIKADIRNRSQQRGLIHPDPVQQREENRRLMHIIGLISDHHLKLYDFDRSADFWEKVEKKDLLLKFFLSLHRHPFRYLFIQLTFLLILFVFAFYHWSASIFLPLTCSLTAPQCAVKLVQYIPLILLLFWCLFLLFLLIAIIMDLWRKSPRWLYSQLLLPRLLGAAIVGLLPLLLNDQSWLIGIQSNLINWLFLSLFTYVGSFVYMFIEVYNTLKFVQGRSMPEILRVSRRIFGIAFSETLFIVSITSTLISPVVLSSLKNEIIRGDILGVYANMGTWLSFGVFPLLIILWTGISLFIGSFVQLLWQDRRITETI